MMQADDKDLLKRIQDSLDNSTSNLDREVLARLNSIREQAIAGEFRKLAAMETDTLIQAARLSLDSSTINIDSRILQQLNQFRQQALSGHSANKSVGMLQNFLDTITNSRLLVPTGAFATACVFVIALSVSYLGPDTLDSMAIEEELLLLASATELELYENLDFYLWLADNGIPN